MNVCATVTSTGVMIVTAVVTCSRVMNMTAVVASNACNDLDCGCSEHACNGCDCSCSTTCSEHACNERDCGCSEHRCNKCACGCCYRHTVLRIHTIARQKCKHAYVDDYFGQKVCVDMFTLHVYGVLPASRLIKWSFSAFKSDGSTKITPEFSYFFHDRISINAVYFNITRLVYAAAPPNFKHIIFSPSS